MAVASLILGIVSIVCSFFGGLSWIGIITGIVGIILGVKGKKDPEKKGMATAGFVCSVIGLILCVIVFIACFACVSALGGSAVAFS